MFLIIIGILCYTIGFMFYMITVMFPFTRIIFLDWIALGIMIIPYIIVLFRISVTRSWKQVDRIPIWKHLIKYLRRDNEMVEVIGERTYPGESFTDVRELGLIEYLGKDCYYSCGDKKFVWVLENINFTPDPRYSNFTHILWKLGFGNSTEIKQVLQGQHPNLRNKVYHNMKAWDSQHGVKKLTQELAEYDGKPIDFKPTITKKTGRHDEAVKKIDSIIWRK